MLFRSLITVREVGIYILEVPTGILADVTGRRRAMVLSFSAYLASFALFTLGDHYGVFVAGMVLFALGEALRSGTHKAMIMEHLELEGLTGEKVHYYGFTRSMSRLGAAVSALAVGVFAFSGGGYEAIFPATMVPYLLAIGLMLTYPKRLDGDPEGEETERGEDASDAASSSGPTSAGSTPLLKRIWRHTVESTKSLFQTPELGKVVTNAAVFDAFFRVAKDYLQPVLQALALALPLSFLHADSQQETFLVLGVVYFFVYMNSFVSSRYSGVFVERTPNLVGALNRLYLGMAAVFFTAFVALYFGWEALAVAVLFFLYTLYNLRKPAVVGYLSERIPKKRRATLLSMENQLRALFAGIAAPLLGLVADHPHLGIPWVFLFAGLAMVATATFLRLKKKS